VAGKYLVEGDLASSGLAVTAESVVVAFCDKPSAPVEVVSLTVATHYSSRFTLATYLSGISQSACLLGVVCLAGSTAVVVV
jgi:hypothetical protein